MNKIIAGLSFATTAIVLSLQSGTAWAHPGVHEDTGVVVGLAHQFTQIDHLGTFLVAAFGVLLTGVVLLMQRQGAKAKK